MVNKAVPRFSLTALHKLKRTSDPQSLSSLYAVLGINDRILIVPVPAHPGRSHRMGCPLRRLLQELPNGLVRNLFGRLAVLLQRPAGGAGEKGPDGLGSVGIGRADSEHGAHGLDRHTAVHGVLSG